MSKRVFCDVSDMKNKVISKIDGMEIGSDQINFICSDGSEYEMWHDQDCCETVDVNDIYGNVSSLIGVPLVVSESVESPEDLGAVDDYDDSFTWTFYRFGTVKGYVDIRWYGTSNGYYSESVSFARIKEPEVSVLI